MNSQEKYKSNGGECINLVTCHAFCAYNQRQDHLMRMVEILIKDYPIEDNFILKMELIRVNETDEVTCSGK